MAELDPKQVPKAHRAYRSSFFQWLGQTVFKGMGWSIEGRFPEDKHIIIALAPHTSNWDFVVGVAALWGLDLKCHWLGKNSLFRPPLGGFMRWLGGIAVDRQNPGTLAEDIAGTIKSSTSMALVITPEGTRSRVANWKTGFLRIARAADCRIFLASMDFAKKTVIFGDVVVPEGNPEEQILQIKAYFKQFTPRHPEKF